MSNDQNPYESTPDLESARAALQESEKKYRALLEEIEDGYLEMDLKLNPTYANRSVGKIVGCSSEDFIKKPRNFIEEKSLKEISKIYRKTLHTGVPNKGAIFKIIRKDGVKRIVESSVALKLNPKGVPIGFRSVVRDITERRQTQEELAKQRSRLDAIFKSVKDAILTVDPDMRVMEANKATESICGMSHDEMIGMKFSDCFKHCHGGCNEILDKALKGDPSLREYRIECKRDNNPQQIVVVKALPLMDQGKKTKGSVLVMRDITRLSDLERKLGQKHQFHNIIGKSDKMIELFNLLDILSDLDTTVLITGESGTGKELVAKALHHGGTRKKGPLITVNCSALAETLLESELFGHVKGAFTGAIKDKQGRFQAANGGTIMLDEIGDISPGVQLKLLRVLQEKEFERVGESVPIKVDVRVIACTNLDLKERIRAGAFREDLYYRLKVMEITIPPLRERDEDIPLLMDHFCSFFNKYFRKNIEGVSDEVLRCFMEYPWPGNVRELEHCIERAFVLCQGRSIELEHLPVEIKEHTPAGTPEPEAKNLQNPKYILEVLNMTGWNKAKAARMLGVCRNTLYRNIYKYQLEESKKPEV